MEGLKGEPDHYYWSGLNDKNNEGTWEWVSGIDSEFRAWKEGEPNSGWIHVSYKDSSNRKQVLTYDGKSYENGLPDMKWSKGQVVD